MVRQSINMIHVFTPLEYGLRMQTVKNTTVELVCVCMYVGVGNILIYSEDINRMIKQSSNSRTGNQELLKPDKSKDNCLHIW